MVVPGLLNNPTSFITVNPSRPPLTPLSSFPYRYRYSKIGLQKKLAKKFSKQWKIYSLRSRRLVCNGTPKAKNTLQKEEEEEKRGNDGLLRLILWATEGVYILWLFLLPYAPGDPVWAIGSDTLNSIVGLSLNFFFVLPLINFGNLIIVGMHVYILYAFFGRVVGIHVLEAPVLHPMSEGLFNFVIGWTFMFAPLLFTDCKRNRYKGSLDVLWGFQTLLTNTFLIPYMAIRLNAADVEYTPKEPSEFGALMIKSAPVVGLICGVTCLISILWALFGRMDGDFGSVSDRWEFLISYFGSERLAYAFVWDIVLYTIFQPWLIGENLPNVRYGKVDIVKRLRFIPVVGLVAYLITLDSDRVLTE
ncbi:transmembrane protein [Thalictrum thalictroides]|uniref:Transmembrane protein n=1 Tax=Thalictrum thalictroides TaxID=46969 RepID=A0A7J6V6I0_THATH|nr:transmembrane protein [Thalictrum thalictroides]